MGAKKTERNEQMIRDREAGMSIKAIAEKYGVNESIVSRHTTDAVVPVIADCKASWPEWELWRNLNKRYGKKRS